MCKGLESQGATLTAKRARNREESSSGERGGQAEQATPVVASNTSVTSTALTASTAPATVATSASGDEGFSSSSASSSISSSSTPTATANATPTATSAASASASVATGEENRIRHLKKLERELLKEREELDKIIGDKTTDSTVTDLDSSDIGDESGGGGGMTSTCDSGQQNLLSNSMQLQPIKLRITRSPEEKNQFTSQLNQSADEKSDESDEKAKSLLYFIYFIFIPVRLLYN